MLNHYNYKKKYHKLYQAPGYPVQSTKVKKHLNSPEQTIIFGATVLDFAEFKKQLAEMKYPVIFGVN